MRCERDAQLVAGARRDREGASSRSMGGPEPDSEEGEGVLDPRSTREAGANGMTWWVMHLLSPVPVVIVGVTQMTYAVIAIIWMQEGRPGSEGLSIHVASSGWPPFLLPDGFFVVCAVFVWFVTIEMFIRPSTSPSGRQPGLMSFFWLADAYMCGFYVWGMKPASGLASPPMIAFWCMAVASAACLGLYIARVRRDRSVRRLEDEACRE